ncbi:nitrogen fixation protein NifHD [Vibrio sp. 10N.286.49.C2]|uniref:P-II family nitrogen regulator n=1 Tax=unclassified Vibrio TaxID=2614977 RepID=UPI000C86030E|nr:MULTISPECIES: P-II family nitrogen regulator [unclassified Vibrio]PMH42937.1 nitrogen fixation protein NifHD [Vibrio sp. 10N.286.49.C2]PMH53724.1 nitrogen fixation protein NifHD [Vibrio sp. 10N.286.49.B1]PMH81246.1 nitrogen fixation protein NifHD [Vibrio sp. 10N.286.48.B7]
MFLVKAIIRPEKIADVTDALSQVDIQALTKVPVIGRGRQSGLKVGDISYKELPKEMILTVVEDYMKDDAVQTIINAARTGDGNRGDGRVFVIPVTESYNIRTGEQDDE